MTFKDLNISEPILRALMSKNYVNPTKIQERAIPAGLENRDILGIAQTGTGKTAAFTIPIIQNLALNSVKDGRSEIKALIVAPTRELVIQIDENIREYSKHTGLKHTAIFGGVNQFGQVNQLKRGTDILVATPGRLLDLINQRFISLDKISYFVIDEADRMLDMGFINDIKKILKLLPVKKQTMLFSATMPQAIATLSGTILRDPVVVEVVPQSSVSDLIEQNLYLVEKEQKSDLLINLLKVERERTVLVFSRTKHRVDRIAKTLNRTGIRCEAIHGNKSQSSRQQALSNFKSQKTKVIIATDIAARGLDIAHLDLVINYDLPDVAETYVHRIGRTGRAGMTGRALTFCSQEERAMIKSIQLLTGKKLRTLSAAF